MAKNRYQYLLASLLFISIANLHAYEDVKLEKIVTLVNKKTVPQVLRLDPENQTWIINGANQSIEQMGADGKPALVLMPGKKPSNLFKEPVDFCFASDGTMVVVDPGFDRVAIIAPESRSTPPAVKDWKKSKLITQFPAKGATAVAVSHDGIIAIGFEDQPGIDIYSMDGVLLHRLFAPDKSPLKNVIAMAYAKNGTLWVLEEGKGSLHRFTADRKWLGATEGFEGGKSVAVDEYGYAYVSLVPGRWREINPEGTLSGVFGTKGKNPGEMLNPSGIAVPDSQHVWVAETGNVRLQSFKVANKDKKTPLLNEPAAYLQVRFLSQWDEAIAGGIIAANGDFLLLKADKGVFEWVDPKGESKSIWKKKKEKGVVGLVHPRSVTTDAAGRIWIADEGDHTIKMVNEAGDVEKTIGQKGKKEGALKSPSLLNVRADGSFVVVDKGESRVQVLSPNGLFLFQVGSNGKKEGQFSELVGIGSNEDTIALLDGDRKALLFFGASGKFLFEIANKEGKAPYWNQPAALAVDSEGRFYALDVGSRRVRIFDRKGQFLADISARGQKIVCGPDHKVMVIDEKSIFVYTVHLVPRGLANVDVKEVEGDLQVSWDNSTEAKNYAIYRSSGGAYTLVTKVDQAPFSDREATPGSMCTYAVVGINSNGNEGNWSLTKTVKAPKRKDVSLLSIEKIELRPVFTAASRYYVSHPIGEITVRNNDEKSFRNVKLAIGFKKYADFPTEIIIPDLAAGESKSVPVTMTFNDLVFELTEDTPVQTDLRLSYFEDNAEKSVSLNAPVTLYSRNAITWTERGRLASFVTPKDPPVVDFSRAAIRDNMALLKGATVGKQLAKAALFYEALNALNISYVPDPKFPFNEASLKPEAIDYVQFPRETLRRKTGDCDDTTALMASLLESVGVSAALVDMPGHILVMANTEESDASVLGLPEERFVKFQGTYWVPIETTRLGQDFQAAWQSGSARIAAEQAKGTVQFVRVSEVFDKFRPVTLVEVDREAPLFPAEKVQKSFPPLLKKMEDERYEGKLADIRKRIKDEPTNHMLQVELGMVHVEGKHAEEGKQLFVSLLKEDEPVEVQAAARNNLGNLAYLAGEYKEAAVHYDKALALVPGDGGVLVNQARTAWRLGDKENAMKKLEEARVSLPEWRDYASDIPAEYLPK